MKRTTKLGLLDLVLIVLAGCQAEPKGPKEKASYSARAVISSLAFSPDGKRLAAGCAGDRVTPDDMFRGEVLVWGIGEDKEPVKLSDAQWINSVAFSLDGKVLAVGGGLPKFGEKKIEGEYPPISGMVRLYRGPALELTETLKPRGQVWQVAFSPDGKTLAASVNKSIMKPKSKGKYGCGTRRDSRSARF